MANFDIDITIPNAPNDPADDQPKMKQNYANIAGFLSVDHVAPGTLGAGTHKEVTFNANNVPGAPSGTVSVEYTNVGVADNTQSQLFWRNPQAVFPLSMVRAFGSFKTIAANGTVGGADLLIQFNAPTIARASAQQYTVTLVTNAITTANNDAAVFVFAPEPGVSSYSIVGSTGVLTINIASGTAGKLINFLVLQI